jgi:ABC-type lipoprotein export system ATPase subunit/bifunctional DNA-binding transcriptional regulator/antitoxin component of YhaV-PrlF toxin-antitoxin module
MAGEAFIRCEGLVKIYKIANLEVFALQGLDMNVNPGELVGIVGASGSGKSTLMNILGGLDRPSAGRVWVEGEDLLKMNDFALNRYRSSKVGFVWQQGARNLIPYLTALENVRLPMTLTGRGAGSMKKRAGELLDWVGLSSRSHHRLAEMSGGEQQRVAIAVSLSNQPRLLLADEPTGELDSNTAAGIFKIFQDLNREQGLTTVIVSHDAGIARHVNRVVSIRDGKTSSETTRQTAVAVPIEGQPAAPVEETFEEVILLDSAGRLQVPREYLEHFQIKRRVLVEMIEEGILIRPAKAAQHESAGEKQAEQAVSGDPRGVKGWLRRLRRKRT